jgi:hypothetical protein
MTHETKPEQAAVRPKKPTPAGKAVQPQGRAGNEAAVTELTDADLQAVTGGGDRGGLGGEVDK